MRLLLVVGGLLLAAAGPAAAQTCEFWVAPDGNNGNPGTFAQPWASFDFAINAIPDSGCTVWAKDGVYNGRQRMNRRFAMPAAFRAVNPYRAVFQHTGTVITIYGGRNIVLEGLEVRHSGPGAAALVIQVQQGSPTEWAEDITIRNCVLHDSYNNDILKINNGARNVLVEGNVFYNQSGSDEHMDVNSVTDVVIQDNIFFNDFAGSGRTNFNNTGSFIVIKDSNAGDDGQFGSERITVRRNVFLNWQGSPGSNFVLTGEDGQPFYEAVDVRVENNLLIGNSPNDMRAPFGVKGCQLVRFINNTVVGDLPSCAYGMRVNQEPGNLVNDQIEFRNNIWSDPTGTMGVGCASGVDDFSDGTDAETTGEVLDDNLYWNGGDVIPPGEVFSPLVHDATRTVGDPLLNTNQAGIVLPRWTGSAFASGNATIRQEFVRLVNAYGAIPSGSPAVGQANPAFAPSVDILGNPRSSPDKGAFEAALPPPTVSISGTTVAEGNSGTTSATFTVTLSHAYTQTVTVQYATSNGTATAGSDYTAASGTVTFPAGSVSQPLAVTVLGDVVDETDETFTVTLSSPSGATMGTSQATGTILDDDTASLVVSDPWIVEGASGATTAWFTVSLTTPSAQTAGASYTTANNTATAGNDYAVATGSVSFAPGQTSKEVGVTVIGDVAVEPDETFHLNLSAPTNAAIADGQGTATIINDDPPGPSTAADFVMLGRTATVTLSDVDTDAWLKVRLVAGRSYAAMAWAPGTDPGESTVMLALDWYLDDGSTAAGGATAFTAEPTLVTGSHEGASASIIPTAVQCPASAGCTYRLRVQAAGAAGPFDARVLVVETTLVSPYWAVATAAGYDAAPQIRNSSSAALPVTFTAYDSTGNVFCANTVTIPANAMTTFGISGGAPGCGISSGFGSSQIAYQGPPGAITANITTFSGLSGLSFDAPFRPRNTWTSLR